MPDYQLVFYVPSQQADSVKRAIFETGAGSIGNYAECCFESLGTGQFRPMVGAEPHLGKVGELEQVDELKVELVCNASEIRAAVDALIAAHPYEEPAYHVIKLESDF